MYINMHESNIVTTFLVSTAVCVNTLLIYTFTHPNTDKLFTRPIDCHVCRAYMRLCCVCTCTDTYIHINTGDLRVQLVGCGHIQHFPWHATGIGVVRDHLHHDRLPRPGYMCVCMCICISVLHLATSTLRFSELIFGILLFEFRFTVFFPLGCGVDSWIPPFSFSKQRKEKPPKEALGGRLSGGGINVTFLVFMSPNLAQCVVFLWIRLIQAMWFASHLLWSSVHITPPCPLASSFPSGQDFLKRASFPIVCDDWFYKKAVWGGVKSSKFRGNVRCGKILRIRRKTPMKWVVSISRNYWVYLDITLQSFEIWEFWGKFWGIDTFYRSKFSPSTGVIEWLVDVQFSRKLRYRDWNQRDCRIHNDRYRHRDCCGMSMTMKFECIWKWQRWICTCICICVKILLYMQVGS